MLSTVRQGWTRASRLTFRPIFTAGNGESSLMNEALSAINTTFPTSKSSESPQSAAPPTTPRITPIRPSASAHFSDLPPVEDPLLQYFTNRLMRHGERQKAQRRMSRIMLHLHAFSRAPPLPLLRRAIELAAPVVRNISTKVGAKVLVRPVALQEKRRVMYAVKWILESSKNQRGQTIEERVAREIVAILNGDAKTLRTKEEVHKFAVQNRGSARA